MYHPFRASVPWWRRWIALAGLLLVVIFVGDLCSLGGVFGPAMNDLAERHPGTMMIAFLVWFISACAGTEYERRQEYRLANRLAGGLCPDCGYDLRAASDRCPECGRAIKSASTPR
jgi:hypothetical protein